MIKRRQLTGEQGAAARLTRREWTALAGALAGSAPLAAQQTGSARDLLKEQAESNAAALAELRKVSLTPADEPIFRLAVK